MEVLTRSKCHECDGAGVVASPIWNEFFEMESKSSEAWEQKDVEDWFRQRGYYYKLPPEEPTCGNCEGSGEIQTWMDTHKVFELANKEALEMLKELSSAGQEALDHKDGSGRPILQEAIWKAESFIREKQNIQSSVQERDATEAK